MGSLLVGSSFAKSMAAAYPLFHKMYTYLLAHFIDEGFENLVFHF
jgi:hypothetical protein